MCYLANRVPKRDSKCKDPEEKQEVDCCGVLEVENDRK